MNTFLKKKKLSKHKAELGKGSFYKLVYIFLE